MVLIMKTYLNYNINIYLKKSIIKQKNIHKTYQIIKIYYNYIIKKKTSPKYITPVSTILQIIQSQHQYKSSLQNKLINKWFNFKVSVISNNVNKLFTKSKNI